jgi:hypothetical protein
MSYSENTTIDKNFILSLEFERYVLEHPEILDKIPDGAELVLLPKDDPELYRMNLEASYVSRQNDDMPDRPVIYIEFDGLAPARSRIKNPRLRTKPPAAASISA